MTPENALLITLLIILVPLIFAFLKNAYMAPMLMASNVVIFIFIRYLVLGIDSAQDMQALYAVLENLAFSPIYLLGVDRVHTLLTSMFLHLDKTHIIFNMIFLIFWAPMLERRIGARRLGLVYLATGLAGGLAYGLINWGEPSLALGASGALFGIAGCFVALYPNEKMRLFLLFIPMPRMRGYMILAMMFIMEAFLAISGMMAGIAHEAHLGGLVAGILLGMAIAKSKEGAEDTQRVVVVSLAHLVPLATTPELRDMMEHIKGSQEPEIVLAWVQGFLEKARCPRCGATLGQNKAGRVLRGKVSCSSCDWSAVAVSSPPPNGPR
ncbi:MAG: rhomboid family intramembrane serine protease [Thermoplasmata archaeon]|nr:rhomboid family intramembrane serine protease [Thermoplasmata archaeon]